MFTSGANDVSVSHFKSMVDIFDVTDAQSKTIALEIFPLISFFEIATCSFSQSFFSLSGIATYVNFMTKSLDMRFGECKSRFWTSCLKLLVFVVVTSD